MLKNVPVTALLIHIVIILNTKLEVYSFNRSGDIRGIPKFQKWVTWPPHDPFWPNFAFSPLELTAIRLLAKFEVSSFNGYREIRGVPKFQNWVTWPPHDPLWPNFAFYSLEPAAIRLRAKFEVSSFNRSRDIRRSPISKTGSRDPHMTPFDLILHFLR